MFPAIYICRFYTGLPSGSSALPLQDISADVDVSCERSAEDGLGDECDEYDLV